MENTVDIDFYHDKDEEAFLEAWEIKHGELEDSAIDALYQEIAQDIHQQIKTEKHELGNKYVYQEVLVGYSDYNTFNNLYLFGRSKR